MDPTVAGDTKPEEKPYTKLNWTLIALIAVSCVAVLLLAATITLAVTGGCGRRWGHERFEKFGKGRMGPMWGPGEQRWREGLPGQPNSSATQNPQAQPGAPQQAQPVPVPGQGP
jgi:hypothetical protein